MTWPQVPRVPRRAAAWSGRHRMQGPLPGLGVISAVRGPRKANATGREATLGHSRTGRQCGNRLSTALDGIPDWTVPPAAGVSAAWLARPLYAVVPCDTGILRAAGGTYSSTVHFQPAVFLWPRITILLRIVLWIFTLHNDRKMCTNWL